MTDTRTTSVHVSVDDARLDLGCGGRGPSKRMMIFTSRTFLGGVQGANFRRIMFRVDGGPPLTVVWRYSDHTAAAFYDDVISPAVARMRGGKELLVRAETYRGELIEATFDITGVDQAIAFVDRSCRG